jgi:hypothetical protein
MLRSLVVLIARALVPALIPALVACGSAPPPAPPAPTPAPPAPAEPPAPPPAAPPAPAPAPAPAAPEAPPPATPNDYAQADNWLCLPGHNAACEVNLDTTVIARGGATKVEKFAAAKAPAIDCFYVYPTVSRDPGIVAAMTATAAELGVVAQQFARFSQVCRPFAPLYRQFTLTALVARMSGRPLPGTVDPKLGYRDVVDAWNYYLANHNKGRGVVLVGHSQGSGVLTELIKNEIDGKPIQRQLVSAILMGTRFQVPVGKDVGGDFASVPLCHTSAQLGCVITYASFRATAPPAASSLFGKSAGPGLEAACVNPAALAGGSGPAHGYFATRSAIVESSSQVEWLKGKPIATQFVSVPGLATAECKKSDVANYLAIAVHPDGGGPRTAEIPGDVVVGGNVLADWGLHLIDASLFIGNLVAIVRDEAAAYARLKR